MATPALFTCLDRAVFKSGYHPDIEQARRELAEVFATSTDLDNMHLMFLVPVKEIPE